MTDEQPHSSAVEQVQAALSRIAEQDDAIKSFVDVAPGAESDAHERDARGDRGPLLGIPIGVKDVFDVAGMTTGCGSPITAGNPPAQDSAACVRRLEELGAVVVGKTVTTEFAYFTPGPTDNPAAPGHTPGGSSSGSAAAVAAGLVPLTVGSQTAGSTIRPAAYCGVASMVLAERGADLGGTHTLAPTLDHLGFFAPTVVDLSRAYHAYAGEETGATAASRVLVWRPLVEKPVDGEMIAALNRAADALRDAGAEVSSLDWNDAIHELIADHKTVLAYEAARVLSMVYTTRRDELGPLLVELIEAGLATSAEESKAALDRRTTRTAELGRLLPPGTVILAPAALGAAPEGHESTGSPLLSRPWQLMGLPAVAIPGARNSAGLPLGLQVIGWPDRQSELLATAEHIESLLT